MLELLVVVAIIAMATAGVSLVLPDSAQAGVERDAQRLAALLESARAQSRLQGVPAYWQVTPQGFEFVGVRVGAAGASAWLDARTAAVPATARLVLGPEPMIGPQSVTLHSTQQAGVAWRVATDGLRPFRVQVATESGP